MPKLLCGSCTEIWTSLYFFSVFWRVSRGIPGLSLTVFFTITGLSRKLKHGCTLHDWDGSIENGSASWFGRTESDICLPVEQQVGPANNVHVSYAYSILDVTCRYKTVRLIEVCRHQAQGKMRVNRIGRVNRGWTMPPYIGTLTTGKRIHEPLANRETGIEEITQTILPPEIG